VCDVFGVGGGEVKKSEKSHFLVLDTSQRITFTLVVPQGVTLRTWCQTTDDTENYHFRVTVRRATGQFFEFYAFNDVIMGGL